MEKNVFDFTVNNANNQSYSLNQHKGQVLLIVNVASKCGFTPQYEELEALYKKFHKQGFTILGFPCNQFHNQEPGTNDEIQKFCKLNYDVTFPILAKINVNGEDADPLYQFLKDSKHGVVGTKNIKWNFTKFLITRDGRVINRYAPATKPLKLEEDIIKALGV